MSKKIIFIIILTITSKIHIASEVNITQKLTCITECLDNIQHTIEMLPTLDDITTAKNLSIEPELVLAINQFGPRADTCRMTQLVPEEAITQVTEDTIILLKMYQDIPSLHAILEDQVHGFSKADFGRSGTLEEIYKQLKQEEHLEPRVINHVYSWAHFHGPKVKELLTAIIYFKDALEE